MKNKIYLFGSSSGGHLFPLLGIQNLLKDEYDITFIGIKGRMEEKIFKEGIFFNIPYSFSRLIKMKKYNSTSSFLKKYKKNLDQNAAFISGGGISSYYAYKLLGKQKLYLLEQNSSLGDANFFAARKAKKILTSFPLKFNPYFYKTDYIYNPSIYRFNNDICLNNPYLNKIVFLFGSLSSSSLVKKTIEFFLSSYCDKENEYVLFLGPLYDEFKDINLNSNIILEKEIKDIRLLKDAKLVFTRSGGTTLFEMLYFKINFVQIPSIYVKHNHQEKNAKLINKLYEKKIINEQDYNPKIIRKNIDEIKKIVTFDQKKYKSIKVILDEDFK